MGEVFKLNEARSRAGREVTTPPESVLADGSGLPPQRDTLANWKAEIATYYHSMKTLSDMDPTDCFIHLSQYSARASEMRSQLVFNEGKREATFRIKIIDPFIEECDRQFKIHSRIQAIREMDARLAGGSFA